MSLRKIAEATYGSIVIQAGTDGPRTGVEKGFTVCIWINCQTHTSWEEFFDTTLPDYLKFENRFTTPEATLLKTTPHEAVSVDSLREYLDERLPWLAKFIHDLNQGNVWD